MPDHEEPARIPDPFDPLGVAAASRSVWQAWAARPELLLQTQVEMAGAWIEVASKMVTELRVATSGTPEKAGPRAGDSRWKHPAWSENPVFVALKEGYLLATQAVFDGIDRAPDLDDETRARVRFFAKQFCDAMSPTNFAFLNPAVLEETVKTGGQNFARGAAHVLEDLSENAGQPALVDKKAFAVGVNVATSPGAVIFRNELIELIRYTPVGDRIYERPLLIVPPWINKFYILDLQPQNSLIGYAVAHGIDTFVISWRNPDASLGHLGFEDYLERGPLAAAAVVRDLTGADSINQVGYCIGGTLTAMELAYLAKTAPKTMNAATFFATLTDFSEAGDLRHFLSPQALATIEEKMARRGILEAADMAQTFNLLRANDLIWNVGIDRYLLGKEAPAFDLLYWNSDATRLPAAMHSYYLTNMYVRNALAQGNLVVRDTPIDLGAIENDVYCVASIEDHIAPWRSVYKMTQSFGGTVAFRLGRSGHIAGIINAPTKKKGGYWTADANPPSPDAWLASATQVEGSWWPDWMDWLRERSGALVSAPPTPGNDRYPTLGPAPGTYVLERA